MFFLIVLLVAVVIAFLAGFGAAMLIHFKMYHDENLDYDVNKDDKKKTKWAGWGGDY